MLSTCRYERGRRDPDGAGHVGDLGAPVALGDEHLAGGLGDVGHSAGGQGSGHLPFITESFSHCQRATPPRTPAPDRSLDSGAMSQSSPSTTTDGAHVADIADLLDAQEVRPPPTTGRSRGDTVLVTALALIVWVGLVFLGRLWGIYLEAEGTHLILYTPPVLGGYRLTVPISLIVPVVAAVVLIIGLPPLARRLTWRATLVIGTVSALVWWIALTLVDGVAGLTDGLAWSSEMANVEPIVSGHPRAWLSGFTAGVMNDGIQVRAHPPGLPLLLGIMNRWGMPGTGWAVGVTLAVAASTVIAVLITVRELAGEDAARRALPFVVLSPAAIWIATSFDALFMGVAAWYVALFVLACPARRPTPDRRPLRRGGRSRRRRHHPDVLRAHPHGLPHRRRRLTIGGSGGPSSSRP